MKKTEIEYNGLIYPAIEIEANKILKDVDTDELYTVAPIALWDNGLDDDCMSGDEDANMLDEDIFFYADNVLMYNNPTEEEVVQYFKELDL